MGHITPKWAEAICNSPNQVYIILFIVVVYLCIFGINHIVAAGVLCSSVCLLTLCSALLCLLRLLCLSVKLFGYSVKTLLNAVGLSLYSLCVKRRSLKQFFKLINFRLNG